MSTSVRRNLCVEILSSGRVAHIIGLGLIGTSVALALQECNWNVTGFDLDVDTCAAASERGVEITALYSEADLVVICVPASAVISVSKEVSGNLSNPLAIITDVAGVKNSIVKTISDARFIGGHPMAGSELKGPQGANKNLFSGCTWILTPDSSTTADIYSRAHAIFREVGANVVAVSPDQHDRLMSTASHVPHLVAGALMNEATETSQHDAVLLQLAAGGFRDMTRIAAGDPTIWPDILFENKEAVSSTLSSLIERLSELEGAVSSSDRDTLTRLLRAASVSRSELPGRQSDSVELAHLRISLSDQPGQLARVTVLASDLRVNIYDIEIAHTASERNGILLLAVDVSEAERLASALTDHGFEVGLA